jgi:hypothetical protein
MITSGFPKTAVGQYFGIASYCRLAMDVSLEQTWLGRSLENLLLCLREKSGRRCSIWDISWDPVVDWIENHGILKLHRLLDIFEFPGV